MALKKDGSLWAWGSNSFGGGIGLRDHKSTGTPTRIGAANDWAAVACGDDFSLALKSDGSLWAWGDNMSGQLGIGNTSTPAGAGETEVPVSTPTRVGKANDWAADRLRDDFSLALKTDGSLWAWGANDWGLLGLGDTASRCLRPARVGAANDWAAVACGHGSSLALKKDGSLWAWGDMRTGTLDGQLRSLATTSPTGPPLPVSARPTTGRPSPAGSGNCLALKNDGSLWAWGFNDTASSASATPRTTRAPHRGHRAGRREPSASLAAAWPPSRRRQATSR